MIGCCFNVLSYLNGYWVIDFKFYVDFQCVLRLIWQDKRKMIKKLMRKCLRTICAKMIEIQGLKLSIYIHIYLKT